MIYAILDIECLNLDPEKSEIFDIGIMVLDEKWNKKFTLEHKIIIENKKLITENLENNPALKYYDEAIWKKNGVPVDIALNHISVALNTLNDKVVPVGHNVKFDLAHLEYNFKKYNIKNPFYHLTLDSISLALFCGIIEGEAMKRYDLGSVTKKFKAKHGNAHTAMGDVDAVYNLICNLKSKDKSKFMIECTEEEAK